MPYRQSLLATGETYHVFNRSVAKQPIFHNRRDYLRALETIDFYRFLKSNLRFSYYNRLESKSKNEFLNSLYSSTPQVIISAFCLMPNHTHFLIRQSQENGITRFMRLWQDSYAKYINTKSERHGSVFEDMFKSVRIESEEQFIHVARYIHLNPLTSYLVKDITELERYPWCSFIDYTDNQVHTFVTKEPLETLFPNINKMRQFMIDQIDYQRHLQEIKHLIQE